MSGDIEFCFNNNAYQTRDSHSPICTMVTARLPKRILEEADPNASPRPSKRQYLKKTDDGKENLAANKWYEELHKEDLRELCLRRKKIACGSKFELIE